MFTLSKSTKEQRDLFLNNLVKFAEEMGYTVQLESPMIDRIIEFKLKFDQFLSTIEDADERQKIYNETINEYGWPRKECRPAGDCIEGINQDDGKILRLIRIREGKGLTGQVSTLIHELTHAMGIGRFGMIQSPTAYFELAAESVTQFVTQALGIDRTERTTKRINGYGFSDFLDTPVTQAFTQLLVEAAKNGS